MGNQRCNAAALGDFARSRLRILKTASMFREPAV
jgi:hypothetical protein